MQQCKLGGSVGGELYVLRMKSEEKRAEESSQEHRHASNPEGDRHTKQASEPKCLLHVNFGRKLYASGDFPRLCSVFSSSWSSGMAQVDARSGETW